MSITIPKSEASTVGVSPKALVATVAPLLVGVGLMIYGVAADQPWARELAAGFLASSPLAGGAAYAASPGTVEGSVPKGR